MQAKVASLHFDALYIPFKDSRKGAMSNDPSDNQRDGATDEESAPKSIPAAATFSKVTDDDKGILTVSLKGCSNLQASPLTFHGLSCKY